MFFASIKNKLLRILARVVTIVLSLILLLLIIANIYVRTNKQKLVDIVNTNINKNISGKFELQEIDLSTFSHFPNIAVDLHNIQVTDSVYHKPLLQCQLLSFRFSIFKLWDIQHQLAKLVIEHGSVMFFTDSSGYRNTSMFTMNQKSSEPRGSFIVHRIEMKDVRFRMDDAPKAKHYDLEFQELTANVNGEDSVTEIEVDQKTIIHALTFNTARGSYLENQTVEGSLDLRFNTATKILLCDKNEIAINGQQYIISARFLFSGEPRFHIDATTKSLPYEKGRALVTPKLKNTLGNIHLESPLDVHASIDGLLKFRSIPLVNLSWETEKNELSAGPVTFKDCSFKGTFVNQIADTLPRTDEFSRVVLKTFSGNWSGLQLEGKNIIVTNLLKPYAEFDLKSNASLSQLENLFASDQIQFLDGTADVALLYSGPLAADPASLKNLTAQLRIKDGKMQYVPKNILIEKCSGEVTIGENKLLFKDFQFDVLHTHININVSGSNISALSENEAGKAAVEFNLYSPYLHFDEILKLLASEEKNNVQKSKRPAIPVARGINALFTNLNFRINLAADTLSKGAFYGRKLSARLLFQKDHWTFENISMQHAGGFVRVAGSLIKNSSSQATATTNIQLQQVNIQQVFKEFNNFGQDGITSQNLRGSLTATVQLSMQLYKRNGSFIVGSRNGYVDFSLKNGAIVNHKSLEQIKVLFLKDRDMSNVRFAELKDRIDVYPSYVYINRMEIQSTAVTMFVEGEYDFLKKNTDILIQVPISNMKKRDKDYTAKNKGVNAKTGASVLIRGKNGADGDVKFAPTLSKKVKANN